MFGAIPNIITGFILLLLSALAGNLFFDAALLETVGLILVIGGAVQLITGRYK